MAYLCFATSFLLKFNPSKRQKGNPGLVAVATALRSYIKKWKKSTLLILSPLIQAMLKCTVTLHLKEHHALNQMHTARLKCKKQTAMKTCKKWTKH